MRIRTAFITGISGQDGSYLAEFLLLRGYRVHGLVRRSSSPNTSRIDHILDNNPHYKDRFTLHHGDLHDASNLSSLIMKLKPDEIYNLAAQSHVRYSFETPLFTSEVTGVGAMSVVDAVRRYSPESKVYQASSSEMFGATPPPQSEASMFHPRSPYAAAKVFAYWAARNYREAYGLFISNGILFNHESPRRGLTFVTKKITKAAANIKNGLQSELKLGNLDAVRDWGYAPDYVVAMWLMLQQQAPEDFVIATGSGTSVREFLDYSFSSVNLDWQDHVVFDPRFLRPSEVDSLIGDTSKAEKELGWKHRVGTTELATLMTAFDLSSTDVAGYSKEPLMRAWQDWLA